MTPSKQFEKNFFNFRKKFFNWFEDLKDTTRTYSEVFDKVDGYLEQLRCSNNPNHLSLVKKMIEQMNFAKTYLKVYNEELIPNKFGFREFKEVVFRIQQGSSYSTNAESKAGNESFGQSGSSQKSSPRKYERTLGNESIQFSEYGTNMVSNSSGMMDNSLLANPFKTSLASGGLNSGVDPFDV